MNYLCIDLGGSNIKGALISDIDIIGEFRLIYSDNFQELIAQIEEKAAGLLEKNSIVKFDGVGIAFAGLVNNDAKKIIRSNGKYDGAIGFDFEAWVKEKFSTFLIIENDARLACIGEWKYGSGKGFDNIVMLTLGTGIGTSAIINGHILRGHSYRAGVLGGHFCTSINAQRCNCGSPGCYESMVSTWVLPRVVDSYSKGKKILPDKTNDEITFKDIFAVSNGSIEKILRMKNYCLDIWATCIISLIYAYDPELVVIGGGVVSNEAEEKIIANIAERVNSKLSWYDNEIPFKQAEYTNTAATLGLAYLLDGANL